VKCLLCSRELGYNNNTSSMLRHYRAIHENKEGHGGGPAKVMPTRKQDLDEALVKLIVKDTQPFSVVEDVGFRAFVALLDPNYVTPTRQAVEAMVDAKSSTLAKMESFVKYFKKTKERERDEGLALANNSSEEGRGRGSSSGVSSEETMREDEDETQVQTRRAEVKVAMTTVQHNIPLAFSDHFRSPLFKECVPDSKIAQKYSSARTKTTAIINKCVAPYFMDELVKNLCDHPFSLATDGSNDTGREKLNPLTVNIWSSQGVIQRCLDMGLTSGSSCGTAEAIFNTMNEVLEGHSIPGANCVALAVDNARVNLGARNSIKSRVLDQHPSIYVLGCPCHIVHTHAHAGGLVYSEMSGFEVEDFCVDLAYWFKSSTKRKNMLHEFGVFCDTTYMEALLPTFCQFNRLFQRQHPCIYLLHGQVRAFIRKLMSKFLKPAAFRTTSLESVDLQDQETQLPDTQLGIGLTTKSTLIRLHEAGSKRLPEHALKKLPLNDPLLPHAECVYFRQRHNSHVDDVLYFVQRYKHLLPFEDPREQDRIPDEFLEYHMLEETDIPDMVWKGAL
ncbi:hypothetical protein KUCAC02_018186, partial [Chaenocephalus aceratus]